ncbi:MAG TPA: DNA polymerase IV [Planctomycetota bacterium]|nr:DNA polymerase IV [Planctomycetota bacterium]
MPDDVAILPRPHARKIVHVDMDAFYASVEQRDRPELRGRPVVVGGSPHSRGVVCAASYEARTFGVRSAMACAKAYRLCPTAVFVAPDFARYGRESERIRAIFLAVTALVEPLSLDEAFLDVTVNALDEPSATRVAQHLRARIRAETGLAASAGVGPSKFVAKVACDRAKPDGICVVPPARVRDFLAPLPASVVPGIGPKTADRLRARGIATIADLRACAPLELERVVGSWWPALRDLAEGIDERPVHARDEAKSVGIEDTVERDLVDRGEIAAKLEELARGLERRLRKHGLAGRTVTLKAKYHDFRRIARSLTLTHAIDDAATLVRVVLHLADDTDIGRIPVRLLGITCSHLDDSGARQEELPFATSPPGAAPGAEGVEGDA